MDQKVYPRTDYLDKVRGFYKSDLIKVVSGIRRCGKSCFLLSIIEDIKARGVSAKDIIHINLDAYGFTTIETTEQLDRLVQKSVQDNDFKYLFIDEIQNVKNFEKLVNAYREEGRFSIFITGSNSYLLSGELVTKLTGRYVEIEMFPLNFKEFIGMKHFLGKSVNANLAEEFNEYIRFGGFPKVLEFDKPQDKDLYIKSVVEQILLKDVSRYRKIRNKSILEKAMTYVINNFGATTSVKSIADYFSKNENIQIKTETLNGYLKVLENAKILYKCPRFDLKSRKSLRNEQKYYLADSSIYFSRNVDARINYGPVLENVVYTYLRAKGYSVSVGRIGKLECDFIARFQDNYRYVQVSMSIADPKVENREYAPFAGIRDNYPKYLFTLDPLLQKRDGVLHCNLVEFMAKDEDLS